ncbi:MAG: prolyl oligopeptidase family serine peptidase [Verrucomicrobiales bacterium]|nr:prolyl oligopeptidase family serine peptidase [Verrucomicrobiales bacterium]
MHRLFCLCVALLAVSGWGVTASGQDLPEGIQLEKHRVASTGHAVWIYSPKNAPSGQQLPCVLIAPAGSYLMDGTTVGEGDMPEHLPYVEAGFIVVSYDLTAPLPEDPSDDDIAKCVTAFTARHGGIEDARDALKLALEKCPLIDPERLFAAGHSSAGTLALMLAQTAPKLRGCIAYAPSTDLHSAYGEDLLDSFAELDIDLRGYADRYSPLRHVADLKCPVFLFHATDDDRFETDELQKYSAAAQAAGKDVERLEVPTGGHYDSMIEPGLSKGIAWLKRRLLALQQP